VSSDDGSTKRFSLPKYVIRMVDFLIALGGTLLVAKLFELVSPEHLIDRVAEVSDNLAPTLRHYNTLGVARSFGDLV
jgi:hypothetical protein